MKYPIFAFLAACTLLADLASAQTFTGGGITINDRAPATPYPSVINVQGVAPVLQPFVVTLHGFTHTFPADVYVVLQAPSGQLFTLTAGCGGYPASNVDLSFSSSSATDVPSPMTTGTYRPTACFLLPQPVYPPLPSSIAFGLDLSTINPSSYAGEWKLFVGDIAEVDTGSIASWSITFPIVQVDPQSTTAFTYQGSLTQNGAPFSGPAQLLFALMDAETGGTQVGASIVANVNVVDGIFTTLLDFGSSAFPPNALRFLQIHNGQTAFSPRQRVSPAPRAVRADRALGITSAAGADAVFTTANSVVSNFMLVSPEFRFNGPNFGYRSLHTASFTPASSTMAYTRDASGLYSNTPGALVSFAAPLDVPSFATLLGVDLTVGYAGGPPVSVTLVQVDHASGVQTVAGSTLVTTPSGAPQRVTVQPDFAPFTIDNNSSSYALVVNWTTPNPPGLTRIVSARVRYTVEFVPR